MPEPSPTHIVLIPSYNSGELLAKTVAAVAARWLPICVVIDASTDGSGEAVREMAPDFPGLSVIELGRNAGKGGAVLAGLRDASARGFTHALVMDGDGQHSIDAVAPCLELSRKHPEAMILGAPIFGPDAPGERVKGRRIGNWWAKFSTLGGDITDSLFGFRVYPVRETLGIMDRIRTARRFDFDTEIVVRLYWAGVRPINVPVGVFYPPERDGGVTHFRYLRDNLLLIGTHIRLALGMFVRLPLLLRRRLQS